MSEQPFKIERILHAYVDNELDLKARRHTLMRIETDADIRQQVCELQRTKEWVKFAFAGERAPTRSLPGECESGPRGLRVAASILVLIGAFAGGWLTHSVWHPATQLADRGALAQDARHVILHIGESNEARFSALLAKAQRILEVYDAAGVQVEVVTNAGGLDLVRTASSRHSAQIRALIQRFDNVRFIACSKGLERLKSNGQSVELIEGVLSEEPAADHLIRRLTEGWTLLRI